MSIMFPLFCVFQLLQQLKIQIKTGCPSNHLSIFISLFILHLSNQKIMSRSKQKQKHQHVSNDFDVVHEDDLTFNRGDVHVMKCFTGSVNKYRYTFDAATINEPTTFVSLCIHTRDHVLKRFMIIKNVELPSCQKLFEKLVETGELRSKSMHKLDVEKFKEVMTNLSLKLDSKMIDEKKEKICIIAETMHQKKNNGVKTSCHFSVIVDASNYHSWLKNNPIDSDEFKHWSNSPLEIVHQIQA